MKHIVRKAPPLLESAPYRTDYEMELGKINRHLY